MEKQKASNLFLTFVKKKQKRPANHNVHFQHSTESTNAKESQIIGLCGHIKANVRQGPFTGPSAPCSITVVHDVPILQ